MNWADLPLVLAIAEAGSLGGAAVALGVDTSTASRRLRALESRLGTKLFELSGRSQVPTAAGRVAVAAAREIDGTVKALESRLMGLDGRLSGPLKVTCAPAVAQYALMQPLADFCRRYPEIEVDVMVTDRVLNMAEREADVAVRATRDPQPSLVGRQAGQRALWGLRYCGLPRAARRRTPPVHHLARRAAATRSDRAGSVPEARVALRVDDLNAMVQAVLADLGLALLPRVVGMSEPRLVTVALDPTDYDYRIWVLRHANLEGSARVRAFADHVFGVLRAQLRAAWALSAPDRTRSSALVHNLQ